MRSQSRCGSARRWSRPQITAVTEDDPVAVNVRKAQELCLRRGRDWCDESGSEKRAVENSSKHNKLSPLVNNDRRPASGAVSHVSEKLQASAKPLMSLFIFWKINLLQPNKVLSQRLETNLCATFVYVGFVLDWRELRLPSLPLMRRLGLRSVDLTLAFVDKHTVKQESVVLTRKFLSEVRVPHQRQHLLLKRVVGIGVLHQQERGFGAVFAYEFRPWPSVLLHNLLHPISVVGIDLLHAREECRISFVNSDLDPLIANCLVAIDSLKQLLTQTGVGDRSGACHLRAR